MGQCRSLRAKPAASVQALLLEYQAIALDFGDHPVAGDEIAAQDLLCQRILDLRLDGALQRPRPKDGIEARFADSVPRGILEPQLDIALGQPPARPAQPNLKRVAEGPRV